MQEDLSAERSGVFPRAPVQIWFSSPEEVLNFAEYKDSKNLKKTGFASVFAGSLELSKEGDIEIKQNTLFDSIFIKQKKWRAEIKKIM